MITSHRSDFSRQNLGISANKIVMLVSVTWA
jgi:hypothetical protein